MTSWNPSTRLRWTPAIITAVAVGCCVAIAAPASAKEANSLLQGVVEVVVTSNPPNLAAPWQRAGPETSWGSGVIIEGDRILTNAHVISDQVMVEVRRAGHGRRYSARVEHVCHVCDLALLTVPDSAFFDGAEPLPIGELPSVQQAVDVYGFPMGGDGISVTSGIVSRIAIDLYSHAWSHLLLVQVDAAINSGNSGGPAISGGRIVGIASETLNDAENIGYIVPAPVIEHFLEDVKDGLFDGFPSLGIFAQELENQALRQQLGLAKRLGGILVTAVWKRGSSAGILKPGDVLLAIDGVPVQEDNRIELDGGVRVHTTYLAQRVQVGSLIELSFLRKGQEHTESIVMKSPPPMVRSGRDDPEPPYRIFAGLVFQPLTLRYLEGFEGLPKNLYSYVSDPTARDMEMLVPVRSPGHRREVVVLTGILRTEMNRGYEQFEDSVVFAVDGTPVRDLNHLSQMLDHGPGDFATITLEQGDVIAVDRFEAANQSSEILSRYQVARDRSSDLEVPASYGE